MGAMHDRLNELRLQVGRHATSPCADSAVPRLSLSRVREPGSGVPTVFAPMVCLVLQGCKQVAIGDAVVQHDDASCLVTSLDLPATGRVTVASPERPYLALGLTLDREALAELIATMPAALIGHDPAHAEGAGFVVGAVTAEQLSAWAGLLALLDQPEDITTLAPLRERELLYRLLRGPLGGHLGQMAQEDGRLARIRRVIHWMRQHHDEPLQTRVLADKAGMSSATFHRHFRAATAMSPLQYQKSVRLHAARRLLASGMEASRAAYSVGYESPSQFSREYRRSFGAPPAADALRLRAMEAR